MRFKRWPTSRGEADETAVRSCALQHNLVDEYRFMVFPVVVGNGQRLFPEGVAKTTLSLSDVKTFSSGVVVLTYGPKP